MTSTFTVGVAQPDGRRWVVEVHTFDDKTTREFGYWGEKDESQYQSIMDDRAKTLQPPTDYYAVMQGLLDTNIAPGTYDAVRKALKDLGGEQVEIGDIVLDITYPEVTKPEDVHSQLQERIDAELGNGAYESVKEVLRRAGFESVTIIRKSNLIL